MTKRKESLDSNNPFLPRPFQKRIKTAAQDDTDTDTDTVNAADPLLDRVLHFLELTQNRPVGRCDNNNNDNSIVSPNVAKSVHDLTEVFQSKDTSSSSSSSSAISKDNVANLILKWTIKHLIYLVNGTKAEDKKDSNNDIQICCSTLALCLRAKNNTDKPSNQQQHQQQRQRQRQRQILSQILTQSVLHKLVPFLADCAFQTSNQTTRSDAASAYIYIISKIYRPQPDRLFNSILRLIIDNYNSQQQQQQQQQQQRTTDQKNALHDICVSMATATLQLCLKVVKSNATNPKRFFQLLSQKDVLLCLSKYMSLDKTAAQNEQDDSSTSSSTSSRPSILQIVKDIIWEGLFSVVHHIEGFRSLPISIPQNDPTHKQPTNKKFKIYQQQLLLSIRDITMSVDDAENVASANHLIPIILEGLIQQTTLWTKQNEHAGSKRKEPQALEAFHFRVWTHFFCHTFDQLQSAWPLLDTCSCLPILRCMRKTIALVETNDIYRPTYADKNQMHFKFLKWQASRVLSKMMDQKRPTSERVELILILKQLTGLNHLVIHDSLPKTIASVVSCGQSDGTDVSRDFIIALIKLYQQLRRIDFLFEAVFSAQDLLQKSNFDPPPSVLRDMKAIFSEPRVSEQIAYAISSCPHGQIHTLFDLFNSSLMKQADDATKESLSSGDQMECGVNLFITILRHVRVDRHAAMDIYSQCKNTLVRCVPKLIDHSSYRCLGLKLCAWILELQTRCAFWMESRDSSDLMSSTGSSAQVFLPILSKASNEQMEWDETSVDEINELIFLACHRIRHLHSQISGGEQEASEEQKEMTNLVSFVFRICSSQTQSVWKRKRQKVSFGVQSPWLLLASFLPVWAPHCTNEHASLFSSWITAAVVGPDPSDESSIGNKVFNVSQEEHEVAMALFQDATFVETTKVTSQILKSGLVRALELLIVTVDWTPQQTVHGIEYTSSPCKENWKVATPQQLSKAVRGAVLPGISKTYEPSKISEDNFLGCARLLSAILSTPISPTLSDSEYVLCFDICIRIDLFFRAVLVSNKYADKATIEKAQGRLRKIIANMLLSKNVPSITNLVSSVDFCTGALEGFSSINETVDYELESATGRLNNTVVIYMAKSSDEKALLALSKWLQGFDSMLTQSNCQLNQSITGLLGLMEGLRLTTREFPESKILLDDKLRTALERIGKDLHKYLVETNGPRRRAFVLAAKMPLPSNVDPQILVELSKVLTESTRSIFIASVLKYNHVSRLGLLDASGFLTSKSLSKLDDTVFGAIVKGMEEDEIKEVLLRVRERSAESERGDYMALHLFRLLVQSLDTEAGRSVLKEMSRSLFHSSLEAMHVSCTASDLTKEGAELKTEYAFELIEILAQHKDVFMMRERDLAMILAQLCLIIRVGDVSSYQTSLFSKSCGLLRSLIQRFPKQLHSCVPSLIMALQVLQVYVLKSDLPGYLVTDKAQQLSRIFEMLVPHRDVLKKHVLSLLLDFIGGLDNKISPLKKKCLTTCAFYLLDTLSPHEFRQLNARLDATGRTLFKSVYQSYKKTHVYRGQY